MQKLMIKTSRNSLTSEADKIMFNEIAPIITKLFSSVTSELLIMPQHWEDKDGTKQKIYNMVSDKCMYKKLGYDVKEMN